MGVSENIILLASDSLIAKSGSSSLSFLAKNKFSNTSPETVYNHNSLPFANASVAPSG